MAPVPGRVVGAVYVGAVNACQHPIRPLPIAVLALLSRIKTARASP